MNETNPVVNDYGDKFWYQDGLLHRLDGPAVEWASGRKEWYQNDKLHHLDGPAIEYANGNKEWYQDGVLHRLGGPDIEWADGIECEQLTEEEFLQTVNSDCV